MLLGSFEERVMLAFVRTADEAYGMSVRRELETVTGRDVTLGSVYATLDRLEAKGLVPSVRTRKVRTPRRAEYSSSRGPAADRSRLRAFPRERLWNGITLH